MTAVLLAGVMSSPASAQETWLATSDAIAEPAPPTVLVRSAKRDRIELSVHTPGVSVRSYDAPFGTFSEVGWPDAAMLNRIGEPRLPVVRRLFIAPENAEIELVVGRSRPMTFDLSAQGHDAPVFPAQRSVPDLPEARAALSFESNTAAYARDAAGPDARATCTELGMLQGHRLCLLEIRPLAYNPVRGELTVWSDLNVKVRFVGDELDNEASPLAGPLSEAMLNPPATIPPIHRSKYLIFVAEDFATAIAPFVDAKLADGFDVRVIDVPVGRTRDEIKAQIVNEWESPDEPRYVLLVGDADHDVPVAGPFTIPTWKGGGASEAYTDLPYACMDGPGDWIADLAIGRFPARDVEGLQAIIDKTLHVARGAYDDPSYVKRIMLMAGTDQTCGDHETYYEIMDQYLEPNNYEVKRIWRRIGKNTQDVIDAFNDGVSISVYYGHSNFTHLYNGPSVTQNDVRGLQNEGAYPALVMFSCNNAKYPYTETIGETFLVEPNKGASAVIGTTYWIYYSNNPGWPETAASEKFFFQSVFEDEIDEIGPAWQSAMMRLLALLGPEDPVSRDYAEMFNLLGDPSLKIPMHSTPGFEMEADPSTASICAGDPVTLLVTIDRWLGYPGPIALSVTGLPPGATGRFSENNVLLPSQVSLTINGTDVAEAGRYELTIRGEGALFTDEVHATLDLSTAVPGSVLLGGPIDGAESQPLSPTLSWHAVPQAREYELEVALDPSFDDVVYARTSSATTHLVEIYLSADTLHYWRVRARNACGQSAWSEPGEFTTIRTIEPVCYNMLNGESGIHHFYDASYDGSGRNDVPLMPLTGGLGELTDGVHPAMNWNTNPEPYVGWTTINPSVVLWFAEPTPIEAVALHLDDSNGFVGVYPPSSVVFSAGNESVERAIEDPPGGQPFWATFDDLGLYGQALVIHLVDDNPGRTIMLSEIDVFAESLSGCRPDLNDDGVVGVFDLLEILQHWGDANGPADLNDDGIVNVHDLIAVLVAWGPCQ